MIRINELEKYKELTEVDRKRWLKLTIIDSRWDMKIKTLQSELKELLIAEEKSKADLLSVFKELGYEIEF